MALINDIYIFVESEDVARETSISSHPVEEGIDLTDHVRQSPLVLSLSGELVGSDYEDDIAQLERLQKDGELVEYTGINILSSALLTKFTTTHTGSVRGGCTFSAELKEIRIASSPYSAGSGSSSDQQVEEASAQGTSAVKTHTVKHGDTLWSIAKSYCGSGASYPKIFDANRNILSDPNKIKPGQILTIP